MRMSIRSVAYFVLAGWMAGCLSGESPTGREEGLSPDDTASVPSGAHGGTVTGANETSFEETYDLVLKRGIRVVRSSSYSATVANINLSQSEVRAATMTLAWTPTSALAEELGVELWVDVPETLVKAYGKSPLVVPVPPEVMTSANDRYWANPIPGGTVTLAVDQPVTLTFTAEYV